MIRTLIAGLALGVSMLPLAAHAGSDMVAAEGGFELWASSVGNEKGWAVRNTETDECVFAEKKDGKVSIVTGEKAEASIADMRGEMPEHDMVWLDGDTNLSFTSSGGNDVRVIRIDGDDLDMNIEIDGEDVDLEKMLAEAGVDIDADLEFEGKDGIERRIIIKTGKDDVTVIDGADGATVTVDSDVTVETDEEGKTETKVKVVKVPHPPHPDNVTVIDSADGKTVVATRTHKIVHEYKSDEDGGVDMSFTHMTGVSAEDAEEFIDDIDDLTESEKDKMKVAMSL